MMIMTSLGSQSTCPTDSSQIKNRPYSIALTHHVNAVRGRAPMTVNVFLMP